MSSMMHTVKRSCAVIGNGNSWTNHIGLELTEKNNVYEALRNLKLALYFAFPVTIYPAAICCFNYFAGLIS